MPQRSPNRVRWCIGGRKGSPRDLLLLDKSLGREFSSEGMNGRKAKLPHDTRPEQRRTPAGSVLLLSLKPPSFTLNGVPFGLPPTNHVCSAGWTGRRGRCPLQTPDLSDMCEQCAGFLFLDSFLQFFLCFSTSIIHYLCSSVASESIASPSTTALETRHVLQVSLWRTPKKSCRFGEKGRAVFGGMCLSFSV